MIRLLPIPWQHRSFRHQDRGVVSRSVGGLLNPLPFRVVKNVRRRGCQSCHRQQL